MLKNVEGVLFMAVLVFSLAVPSFAKGAEKEGRVEGKVVRSNQDKSTLTVRLRNTDTEKIVHYDASTKWTSQFHHDKKVNTIEPSDVKDGDQVICLGTNDDKGEFHANAISKRLSHSPQ